MEMNEADKAKLLSIFPEEVWVLLLEQVQDANDLVNISNASLFFRKLLGEKRVLFLFPKVWDILGIKIELEDKGFSLGMKRPSTGGITWEDEENSDRSTSTDCSSDELCVYRDEILNLRLVCRNWNTAVATFYQNLTHYYKLEYDAIQRSVNDGGTGPVHDLNFAEQFEEDAFGGWTQVKFVDYEPDDLPKFVQDFETSQDDDDFSPQNPFISRGISIFYTGQEEDFFNPLFQLLAKYGRHIWHCTLKTNNYFPTVVDYYSKLQQILECLPNLKVLKFETFLEEGPSGIIKWAFCDDEYNEEELQAHIISNPLPRLGNLKFLKALNLPVPIFNALVVGVSPHLPILEVISIDQNQDYDYYASPLPNLTQLSITVLSVENFKKLADSQENWPLEKLYLDYAPPPLPQEPSKRSNWRMDSVRCQKVLKWSRENLTWSEMFRVIENKWATTLTDVMINLPKFSCEDQEIGIMKDCPALRLNLPHVKRFKVIMTNVASLDFILPMKDSLELLDITIGFEFKKLRGENKIKAARDLKEGQLVQFLGYFTDITGKRRGVFPELKSNIWTLFAKLKAVRVFVTDCMFGNGSERTCAYRITTREQWQKEMNS